MDRNFYYSKLAQQHQSEISQKLANGHLLKKSELHPSQNMKQETRMTLRLGTAFTVITILLMLGFLI